MIVLGAGLAGMTVAYELGKLGYACQVLEARERPGGRAHTVRRGTVSEEDAPPQTCTFDEGQYFNCGAMRIAYHHATTLAYCRELQVPVETFALVSEAAYLYQTKSATMQDRRVRFREVHTDMDGYVSELLGKAVSDHALDEVLTAEDRDRLLEYLRGKGALDASGKYKGGPLRGPDAPVAFGEPATHTPLPIGELLGSRTPYYLDLGFQYQQSMLQVVGGTDQLPKALASRLAKKITYRAAVTAIRQSERGVTVTYRDARGATHQVQGDYCVAALPLPLLAEIDTDFAPDFKAAIARVPYAAAGKMGLQFKRRFWEETITSSAARRRPTWTSARSSTRPPGISAARVSSSVTTCRGSRASHRRKTPAERSRRSSRAAASTRTAPSSRAALGGLAPRDVEPWIGEPQRRRPAGARRAAGPGLSRRRPPQHERLDAGRLRSARQTATVHGRPVRPSHGPPVTTP